MHAHCKQPEKADRKLTNGKGLVREGEESEGANPTVKLPSDAKGQPMPKGMPQRSLGMMHLLQSTSIC